MLAQRENKAGRTIWISRGWHPVHVGFCPDQRAWQHLQADHGLTLYYPADDVRATAFTGVDGEPSIVITLGRHAGEHAVGDETVIAGAIAHGASLTWSMILEEIDESAHARQIDAYAVQAIFQEVYSAYRDRGSAKKTRE